MWQFLKYLDFYVDVHVITSFKHDIWRFAFLIIFELCVLLKNKLGSWSISVCQLKTLNSISPFCHFAYSSCKLAIFFLSSLLIYFLMSFFSRHCGRVLCGKCSDKDVPILKFGLNKPVRVCELCFDVLTVGAFWNLKFVL